MHHGKDFWLLVEQVLPDHRTHRQELRTIEQKSFTHMLKQAQLE
jgi:predicted metal-dependent hydrolase